MMQQSWPRGPPWSKQVYHKLSKEPSRTQSAQVLISERPRKECCDSFSTQEIATAIDRFKIRQLDLMEWPQNLLRMAWRYCNGFDRGYEYITGSWCIPWGIIQRRHPDVAQEGYKAGSWQLQTVTVQCTLRQVFCRKKVVRWRFFLTNSILTVI